MQSVGTAILIGDIAGEDPTFAFESAGILVTLVSLTLLSCWSPSTFISWTGDLDTRIFAKRFFHLLDFLPPFFGETRGSILHTSSFDGVSRSLSSDGAVKSEIALLKEGRAEESSDCGEVASRPPDGLVACVVFCVSSIDNRFSSGVDFNALSL